ncbi:MAG: hypothetical protein ACI81L_002937 [Verrucomicrobiales bacterium]|jgi:hypothetical protein
MVCASAQVTRATSPVCPTPEPYAGRMEIALLYFEGCPSWRVADGHLKALVRDDPEIEIRRVIVDTPEAAEQHRFRGSPSIHVDGEDLFADSDAPVGLSCRIYRTPDGLSGSPTLNQLQDALSRR